MTGARAVALRRGWRRARRSLRARLIALFVLLAVVMTMTFVGGMQVVLRSGWEDLALPLGADYVDRLTAEIGTPPDIARAEALTRRLPLRISIDGPLVTWSSHPQDRRAARRELQRAGIERPARGWHPVRMTADGHRIGFGFALLPREDAPGDRARLVGWATLGAMLLLVALAYLAVRRLLRPLADIRAGAIRYGSGDFSTPIPKRSRDELGTLAVQINAMADGLHRRLDAKRQLLLAISHELRSPLTRARLNVELVDASPARDALLHDLAEMRDLIADLLESERLAEGHAALHAEAVDLNRLAGELIAGQFAAAPIRLTLAPELPLLQLDALRIRLLLRNLLDNALRHGGAAAEGVALRTWVDGARVHVAVRDHGPGVDDAQLAQLGEAFYRPDSARQRSSGGAGLGLYLCRLIAAAHGGALHLRNAHPGLDVELELPRGTG